MSGMSCVEEGEAGQLLSAVMVVGLHPHKLETVQGALESEKESIFGSMPSVMNGQGGCLFVGFRQ